MTKLNLIFTFDYELPLGGCSSYSKGLFEPADAVIQLAESRKIKIVLFADICSAMVFKKWDYRGYYQPFAEQLKQALSCNHEVQLHIHPHWLDSLYENGKYKPSNSKILSNFRDHPYPLNIGGIIESSASELNEICSVTGKYRCIAYRGGGYNLQPDTDLILTSLYNNGIRFDSSVIKGYYFESDIQNEDFRRMPVKANWKIPLEGPINSIGENGIMEIPIASMPAGPVSRLHRIYKKIRYKSLYRQLKYDNKGTGHTGKKASLTGKIKSSLFAPLVLSFDHLHLGIAELDSIIRHQLSIYRNENEIALCVNSHPKTMGPHHLGQMAKFIDLVEQKYGDTISICGYNDLKL
jgi:hypothetical protein